MSQGIFGVVDFSRVIENPEELASRAGQFLSAGVQGGTAISLSRAAHYILGMKRNENGFFSRQTQVAECRNPEASCVIHGGIYNYEDLLKELSAANMSCNGDLDLALHLYRRHGAGFGKRLNGLFTIAVVDHREKAFFLLNDRFGLSHQVYWTVINGRLFFATHLKTLLAFPGVTREVDVEAMNLFLKYSYISSPWTIFKGIRKLPPGHLLRFNRGECQVEPYWDFVTPQGPALELHEAVDAYRSVLKKAVARRLGQNSDAGILLSGGLDSSANVALAAECATGKIKTFSIGFANAAFDERPYARTVASHFGTEHFEYAITGEEIEDLPQLVWNIEEPYFEFGLFLTYLGMATARKEVGAIIGGEGADQLFGTGGFAKGLPVALHFLFKKAGFLNAAKKAGAAFKTNYFYDHDNLAFKFRLLWNRATDLNDWYFYGYDEHELRFIHRNPLLAKVPRLFQPESLNGKAEFRDVFLDTQINQDLRHYVNENVMVKSGRMADALDLDLRESYLDADVTDFLVSLDYPLKRKGGLADHLRGRVQTKHLHRKAMEGLLPKEIMRKPKQGGFVPVMIFLNEKEKREKIYQRLVNSRIIKEYFRVDVLRNLFEQYETLQGKKIYWHNFHNSKANRILFLLTLDIWHSLYIENDPLEAKVTSLSDFLSQ
ncbi:AsnB: asparagine synthetase [Candidatus Sulfobium mesophilum]|uniref:asparagine synthase (glutamine-hydrolyzing) n=1 Tax=Candidatus Sulfobium mesophilum TaxID=2016548 RepID=A0A2U3QDM2_9BACT|nr:AsnB: asparagine synthetase [Candidatus Sulfobium mesophilum]